MRPESTNKSSYAKCRMAKVFLKANMKQDEF